MKEDKRIKRKKRLQKKKDRQQQVSFQEKNKTNQMESLFRLAEPSFLMVESIDEKLIRSNYWETEEARNGFSFLSINAGVFRLMVPENKEHLISEFKTGEYCIVSKGPSMVSDHPFMIELLFEDHTDTPYQLTLSPEQVDRNPASTDAGRKFKLSVWTKGCKKVMEMDAYYRVVDRIPYRKPLGKEFKNVI